MDFFSRNRTLPAVGLMLLLTLVAGGYFLAGQRQSTPAAPPLLPRVAHAGGAVDGATYTNSFQALNRNAEYGFEMFEIDFSWTADGELVCMHDWGPSFRKIFGFEASEIPTLAEFTRLNARTPTYDVCTLDSLSAWMDEHPEAVLVTDVKKENIRALERIRGKIDDFANRVIPQIYFPEEYRLARDLGYRKIIWTLYRYPGDFSAIVTWARKLEPFAVTMPKGRARENLAAKLAEIGIPSYVHTVNNLEEYDELVEKFKVSSIYTDFLSPAGDKRPAIMKAAPVLTCDLVDKDEYRVQLSWDEVAGAEGYVLDYAPAPFKGVETIKSIELGRALNKRLQFEEGGAYFIAVKAFDEHGVGPYSNIEQIEF